MAWVDDLVPPSGNRYPVLTSVCEAPITDAGTPVQLGPIDQSCAGLAYHLLGGRSGTGLVLLFPRGRHELAILLGCVVQLVRLAPRATDDAASTTFNGPVVVVAMDTLVHERLACIRIANQPSHHALSAGRIRSDGKMVDSEGAVREIIGDELLYLNTRVGWPPLPRGIPAGVVIIDRSTFSSAEILDHALNWAAQHNARHVIVIGEIGDEGTIEQSRHAWGYEPCVWPWTDAMVSDCLAELGPRVDTSSLSANELQGGSRRRGVIRPSTAEIESLSERVLDTVIRAAKVRSSFPRSLQTARRLFNGLMQLPCDLETHNRYAALDHRTSALSSLRHRIDNEREPHVGPEWASFYMARWTDLRLDLLNLYQLVEQSNPKFLGLALALEWIREQDSTAPVCIRVPSEAAGMALAHDMADLMHEWPIDGESISWHSWSKRLAWKVDDRFEILSAAPPPSLAGLLWSAETSRQLLVLYGFELTAVTRRIERTDELSARRLTDACTRLGIGDPPNLAVSASIEEVVEFDRNAPSAPDLVSIAVDLDVMFTDVIDAEVVASEASVTQGGPVTVVPIVLEPDGHRWLLPENAHVETLVASKVVYLPVGLVKRRMTVVVPRGGGRQELFSRLVAATHQSQELQTFEVLFARWRQACWNAYAAVGHSWTRLEARMRELGSQVTGQSPRTWALGHVLGPEDRENIRRIGTIAGDPVVEGQYKRIDAMVRQVRSLHMRLGALLSAAMSEALGGGGANLEQLRAFLGGMDPSELLDEFELRSVRSVGAPEEVPGQLVRRVVPA